MAAVAGRLFNRAPRGYCETPNALVVNLGLLTHAELCLALVNCRRGDNKPIPDELWSEWTGLHPRMKQHAAKGLTKRGCLRVEGKGNSAKFTFDRDAWNQYVTHAERSKPRTAGRRAVDPKPAQKVDPECRERGCGLLRMRCGETGLSPDTTTQDAKPVSGITDPMLVIADHLAAGGSVHVVPVSKLQNTPAPARLSLVPSSEVAKPVSRIIIPTDASRATPGKVGTPTGGGRTPAPQTSPESVWLSTLSTLRSVFPLVGLEFLARLLAVVCSLFADVTDSELAKAIRVAWAWKRSVQAREGLFLLTVPEALRWMRAGGDTSAILGASLSASSPPFDVDRVSGFVRRNARALRDAGEVYGPFADQLEIVDVAAAVDDLGFFESALHAIERDVIGTALCVTGESVLVELRALVAADMRAYDGRMTGEQREALANQYLEQRLLEAANLPRLSLFYL
jgi:hypothetical protein